MDRSQAEIEATLRAAVLDLLARAPIVDTVDGPMRRVPIDRDRVWCHDPRGAVTFSELVVRDIQADGTPVIEAILDRPLLGSSCKDPVSIWACP